MNGPIDEEPVLFDLAEAGVSHVHVYLLGDFVRRACQQSELRHKHYARASRCASYLYNSGFLERQKRICSGEHSGESRDSAIERSAKLAFLDLQAVKLIPSGVIISILWSWIIMPFLRSLLEDWLFSPG